MTKEFDLSKKIRGKTWHKWDEDMIFISDVKQFIKLLKKSNWCLAEMRKEIDKLAGKSLI